MMWIPAMIQYLLVFAINAVFSFLPVFLVL